MNFQDSVTLEYMLVETNNSVARPYNVGNLSRAWQAGNIKEL